MAIIRGPVLLALTVSNGALALFADVVRTAPAVAGAPKTNIPKEEAAPKLSREETFRIDSFNRLEQAEKNLRRAMDAKSEESALVGLRGEVKKMLKEVEGNGADQQHGAAMLRVRSLLLKGLSDSARGQLKKAMDGHNDPGGIKRLQVAIASSLGKQMEIEALVPLLNQSDSTYNLLKERFNFSKEVLPAQSFLDEETAQTEALAALKQADRATMNPLRPRTMTARLRAAVDRAESAGVPAKEFSQIKSNLVWREAQEKAMDTMFGRQGVKTSEELLAAIKSAEGTSVHESILEKARQKVVYLREKEARQDQRSRDMVILNDKRKINMERRAKLAADKKATQQAKATA